MSYTYDAWGNPESISGSMASTLGAANPFRYRSYYFDTESGLYYLMSRYYDPVVGRFLNADSYVSTGQGLNSGNMFAYCLNNPMTYYDSNGNFAVYIGVAGSASFIFHVSAAYVQSYDAHGNWSNKLIFGLGGGVFGASAGTVIGIVWGADTVHDLDKLGAYSGMSAGPLVSGGVDLLWSKDKGAGPIGIQIFLGLSVGSPLDIHSGVAYTIALATVDWSTIGKNSNVNSSIDADILNLWWNNGNNRYDYFIHPNGEWNLHHYVNGDERYIKFSDGSYIEIAPGH